MDFKKATETLCAGVSHEKLAKALGVSVATVRQARLRSEAKAYRSPPENWEDAIIQLAEERVSSYCELIKRLKIDGVSREPRHTIHRVSRTPRHTIP